MPARYFRGWNVVAATFVMALLSFGLGFYGLAVYVATLQRLHGWSASVVSAPVTVYYVAGALLTASIGDLDERFGPRAVVSIGTVAMAAGVAGLGRVTQPWQLYPSFLVATPPLRRAARRLGAAEQAEAMHSGRGASGACRRPSPSASRHRSGCSRTSSRW